MKTYLVMKPYNVMPIKKTDTKETVSKDTKKSESKNVKDEESKQTSKASVKETKDTKETKNTKKVEKVEKVVVEEVSSDESDDSDVEMSDNESQDGDAQVAGGQEKDTKEKKPKKTWQEVANEWEKVTADLKENESKHKELQEQIHKNEKARNELERQRNRLYAALAKSHDEEIKRVAKEKPKRKGNKEGGFNKELPVPPKLVKYLGLEDGVKMSRPKVMSLLNDKFKTEGLKNGQTTVLDKTAAKVLGKEKDREIKFTEFQSFLKEFYEEAFPSKTMDV
jgi:hypothetical protein